METILRYEDPTFQNQGIFPALYLWNEVGDPQFFLYFWHQ